MIQDPLTDVDWPSHWRRLVETAELQGTNRLSPAYWDQRAASFAYASAAESRPFLQVLEPFLSPAKTLIDV